MKLQQTEITPTTNSYISLHERNVAHFSSPFHCHPELELVYVKESYGKRIIGDVIEVFEPGDMVFCGSNLPHVWLNDELYYKGFSQMKAKAIVLYFNRTVFDSSFYRMHECEKINELFAKAMRGIRVQGNVKETIAEKLELLLSKTDFDRTLGLLEILHLLSQSEEISLITGDGYMQTRHAKKDRLSEIYRYIHVHFQEDINLGHIAAFACMTPPSFCRFLKKELVNTLQNSSTRLEYQMHASIYWIQIGGYLK